MENITEHIKTDSAGEIAETLQFMLDECSADEAPNRQTVELWRDILQQRQGKFVRLADLCQAYLDEIS